MREDSYAPPIQMPSEKADLLDKIQPTLIVDVIFHRLLGEHYLNGKWIIDESVQSRALTRKGAWDIATLMMPVSSQNVSLSKLKDSEIKARLLNITRTAQIMCLRNYKEYGIKGADQLHFVHEIIFSNTLVSLKQPEGAGLRNFVGDIGKGDIGYSQEEEQPKGWNVLRR
jgi:hypothetical protein